jgi:hypothetical protein
MVGHHTTLRIVKTAQRKNAVCHFEVRRIASGAELGYNWGLQRVRRSNRRVKLGKRTKIVTGNDGCDQRVSRHQLLRFYDRVLSLRNGKQQMKIKGERNNISAPRLIWLVLPNFNEWSCISVFNYILMKHAFQYMLAYRRMVPFTVFVRNIFAPVKIYQFTL